ncbi:MAG: hypothetical protein DWQ02_04990 [Bacteroidetes bacterium]|nr:MAG: hypothetical protein DWQ02_04990 [Bacteroidota bacterium]
MFKGQVSVFELFNPNATLPLWTGARYIPQLNYEVRLPEQRKIDFEASANIFGTVAFHPFDSLDVDGDVQPYRIWGRYSTPQFELRAGLQKINFGSASLLRPLMWFDQRDPRDPLQLTNGVYGILARYYFLNNANVWVWGLYGNDNNKGWEVVPSHGKVPEFGGRFQTPVPRGEAAITFHHRTADSRSFYLPEFQYEKVAENKIGVDAKFDLTVGCWFEATWVNKSEPMGMFTNQEIINLGLDYTFGIGNGLNVIVEQLIAGFGEQPFEFEETATFTLLNLNYPIGFFDNINAIVYFDWGNKQAYNFLTWQKQFNNFSLYVMGFVNPKTYNIPTQTFTGENLFAGSGLQVMVVYNH